MEVQYTVVPDHAGCGAHAVIFIAKAEQHRPLGIVCIETGGTVGAVVVDNSTRSHYDTATALLHSFHMAHMATPHPNPETSDIVGTLR